MNKDFERLLERIASGEASHGEISLAIDAAYRRDQRLIGAGFFPTTTRALKAALDRRPDPLDLMAAISEFC